MLRFVLSAAGLVLAVAGFVVFVALAGGVWAVKREADQQVVAAAAKAHSAADVAARVIALIREVIARARLGLTAARTESAAVPPAEPDLFVRMAMRQARRELPAQVDRARDAVGVASDALVVAGAALDVFEGQPGDGTALGIRPEEMQAARGQLDAAGTDLRNARTVLGVALPADGQLANVDAALDRAQALTDRFDGALARARQKVDTTRTRAELWALRGAAAVSALAALAALGQVFMARACWRGLRKGPAAA
jgi:hypothetical protein